MPAPIYHHHHQQIEHLNHRWQLNANDQVYLSQLRSSFKNSDIASSSRNGDRSRETAQSRAAETDCEVALGSLSSISD